MFYKTLSHTSCITAVQTDPPPIIYKLTHVYIDEEKSIVYSETQIKGKIVTELTVTCLPRKEKVNSIWQSRWQIYLYPPKLSLLPWKRQNVNELHLQYTKLENIIGRA